MKFNIYKIAVKIANQGKVIKLDEQNEGDLEYFMNKAIDITDDLVDSAGKNKNQLLPLKTSINTLVNGISNPYADDSFKLSLVRDAYMSCQSLIFSDNISMKLKYPGNKPGLSGLAKIIFTLGRFKDSYPKT